MRNKTFGFKQCTLLIKTNEVKKTKEKLDYYLTDKYIKVPIDCSFYRIVL